MFKKSSSYLQPYKVEAQNNINQSKGAPSFAENFSMKNEFFIHIGEKKHYSALRILK